MSILDKDYDWESHLRDDDGVLLCTRCSGIGVLFAPTYIDGIGTEHPPITMACHCCRGTGLLVHMLVSIANDYKRDLEIERKRRQELKEWIKTTSTCTTCEGQPSKTMGGIRCKECTLMGTCPWGG